MSELEQAFNFKELGEESLDFDAIFGGGNIPAPPPPVPETVQEPEYAPENGATAEQPSVQDTTNTDAGIVPDMVRADTGNEPDLFAALAGNSGTNVPAAKPKEDKPKQVSLFDKPPIFSYGGAKESIKDTSMTFEELRIAKSDDFPELAEGKKVSWSVEYGKTTKYISDPKETTIASVKEEIEKSKAFLDGLKKAKDKDRNPDCLVKPKVTAQSKGTTSYKGVFPSVEAAKASDKVICLIPGQDGRKVDIFEDFINLLGGLNRNDTPLMVNSFYIIDDEKQRAKMTEEFYAAVKKEIATYQERADYLIKSGSQSPAVMDRWVLKIQGLEEKKRHYEQVLRWELDGLDDEFSTLKFLSQELQMRSRSIRFQKAA